MLSLGKEERNWHNYKQLEARQGIFLQPLLHPCLPPVPRDPIPLHSPRALQAALSIVRALEGGRGCLPSCETAERTRPFSLADTWHPSPQKSFAQTGSVSFSDTILCLVGARSAPGVRGEILKIKEPPPPGNRVLPESFNLFLPHTSAFMLLGSLTPWQSIVIILMTLWSH